MLTSFRKQTGFTEARCQSQVAEESKKQLQDKTNGTNKPETQWFCVHKR